MRNHDEMRLVEPDAALLALSAGCAFSLQFFALAVERVALASLAFAAGQFRQVATDGRASPVAQASLLWTV